MVGDALFETDESLDTGLDERFVPGAVDEIRIDGVVGGAVVVGRGLELDAVGVGFRGKVLERAVDEAQRRTVDGVDAAHGLERIALSANHAVLEAHRPGRRVAAEEADVDVAGTEFNRHSFENRRGAFVGCDDADD